MLLVNDVYTYGRRNFRILWRDANLAYWIDIDAKSALPEPIKLAELISLLENQTIQYIPDPFERFALSPPSQKGEWGKKIQAEGWSMISPYVQQEPEIYCRVERGKMIQLILAAHNTTKQTVYAKLRAYWQKGKSSNCLYPDTRKIGGAGKTKSAGLKKRGRPRTVSLGLGVNITEEVANIFRTAIKSYYQTKDNNTLDFAYNKALIALGIDSKKVSLEELAEAPTYEQFYHFMRKETGAVERIRKRLGEIQYQKDIRPVLGTSSAGVMGPGSLYQIDATIADIYLLSESDRSKIVGRPTLYIVIDVFSRLITGIYVGLEPPSWVSAMGALANSLIDKVAYCASHGFEISHEEWPVIGKPEAILGDRGEMLGHTLEIVSEAFNIDIQNTPPYRADWKGIVERQFNTIQQKFKPYVEGYVTGDIGKKRAGKDYRLDAELTLSEFTKVIIACVLEYNTTHCIDNYDADKDIPPELPHNPLLLWNWGVSNRTGKLRGVNQDLALVNLLPHKEATVSEEGIDIFGCKYSTAMAIREGWFDRIDDGPKTVKVAYNPYSTNKIYLRPDGKYDDFVICELTERSREYRDLTFWDVWRINKIKKKAASRAKLTRRKGRLGLDETIEEIVIAARAKNPDLSSESKSSRTEGIRKNRANELSEKRREQPELLTRKKTSKPANDNVTYINPEKTESFDIPDMLDDLYGDGPDE